MAVRVLLLFVSTGLFAAGWNSDHPASGTRRLASDVRSLPDRPSSTENDRSALAIVEVGRAATMSAELDPSLVLLPELIAPGTYRVVDTQGRVAWMSIPHDNSPERAATEPQPVYSSESAIGRWYFIRVDAAPVIASPPEATAVLR